MNGDFRVGAWLVQPNLNTVSRNGTTVRLEPKVMEVLVCLASQPGGEPLSKEVILKTVWPDTFVTEDVLTRSISELRRTFLDDARDPRIIQTIPKRGYRLVAPVEREPAAPASNANPHAEAGNLSTHGRRNLRVGMVLGLTAAALLIILILLGAGPTRIWRRLPGKAEVPQIRSIAVLGLKNLSGDAGEQYFAAGITNELISDLSQIRALTIISRTSSEGYADTNKSLAQIGRELGVDGIVKGTVIRSGGRVRVTAELMRVAPEKQVWAGSFETGPQEIVTQQRILARKIAVAVAARLTPEESQRLARATPVNPEAYNDYLLGEYYMWNWLSPEGREEAVRYLERAVAEDPSYAPSHASLSQAYFRIAPEVNNSRPNELFGRSKATAFKAAELDASLPDAHRMLGVIYFVSWDVVAAGKEFERAMELQPGDARNLYFHAIYLGIEGHHEEAISEARRAAALDPLNVSVQGGVGKAYLFAGRYDEAIAEFSRMLEKDPGSVEIRASLALAYEQKGDYPRALVELEKSRSDRLASARCVSLMGYIFAKEGKRAEASARVRELVRMSQDPSYDVSPLDFATIYAGMGNTDKSIDWLQRAYRQHAQSLLEIKSLPELTSLRPDPRFQDLVRRLGLE